LVKNGKYWCIVCADCAVVSARRLVNFRIVEIYFNNEFIETVIGNMADSVKTGALIIYYYNGRSKSFWNVDGNVDEAAP